MSENNITIQVLGSGCPTCKKLYDLTRQVASELKIEQEVEYITDIQKIVQMGVMQSPVLAVNGKPVIVGLVPDVEKIKEAIQSNL